MKKHVLTVIVCLLMFALFSCAPTSAPNDSSFDDINEPKQENTDTPENASTSPTDKPYEKTGENEEIEETEEIVLLPCLYQQMTFTSLSEMKEQLSAIKTLSADDERYEEYAVLNIQDLEYYYQPNLPSEYQLVTAELLPNLIIYTYEIPEKPGMVQVTISRVWEEDPLIDVEQVTQQRRYNGYVYTRNHRYTDIYFTIGGGYVVQVAVSMELFEANNVFKNYWDAAIEICGIDDIQRISIKSNHVTE